MLHEFIAANRESIIERTRERVQARPWPSVSPDELESGVPQFLTQIVEILQAAGPEQLARENVSATAAKHGADLLQRGYNVSQVVHDYGDICQVITQIAVEQNAPITVDEFHTLNLCLDIAIAGAVTEHARLTAQTSSAGEVARLGQSAHELRDVLNSALLAFHALRRGTVAINGSTGEILGRSLVSLRDIIDRAVAEVRLTATELRHERIAVAAFLDEIGATGTLHAEYRRVEFTVEPADQSLSVCIDPQLLSSAVMNLVSNAFKFTPPGGHIVLRAFGVAERVHIEVEDECGGIPANKVDLFKAFGDRRGTDRSGLGLGLSISRTAVRAHGGDIDVRNMPGKGCVFVIDLPLASEHTGAPTPAVKATLKATA